jgi:ADP-ribose pyrophosphatase YjhB (NUDIX family)
MTDAPESNPSRPRIGCGAAILDGEGGLLLVKRRRPPEADHWGLPGGKLDWGESARDCVEREIAEELGITISAGDVLCVSDLIGEGHHWVAPVYRVDEYTGEPAIQEPEALADWGWFALDALPAPLTQATRDAVAALGEG